MGETSREGGSIRPIRLGGGRLLRPLRGEAARETSADSGRDAHPTIRKGDNNEKVVEIKSKGPSSTVIRESPGIIVPDHLRITPTEKGDREPLL